MSSEIAAFEIQSIEVAKKFLQTVVVVDDRASLSGDVLYPEPKKLANKPGRGSHSKVVEKKQTPATQKSRHDLNAKKLIDMFAECGLVCAVLKPGEGEDFVDKTDHATQRADIVVLDWKIHESYGEKTIETIRKIISTDSQSKDHLRLISIYTGEKDLREISKKIKTSLASVVSLEESEDGFVLSGGAVKIVIFAKEGTATPDVGRIVSVEKLPDRLIGEFSKTTMGLLSNATLESLAAIRSNTHRLLKKFNADLDASYLSHRALSYPAEDAQFHHLPLVVSEIQDILEGRNVSALLSVDNIKSWLLLKVSEGLSLSKKMRINGKANALEAMYALIVEGVEQEVISDRYKSWKKILEPIKSGENNNSLSLITEILSMEDGSLAEECDRKLAQLMSIRSRYESPPPALKLGTIIAEDREDGTSSYFFCIQPVCDSVRLSRKNGREFPFLPMKERIDSSKSLTVVVPDKDKNIELRLSLRPHESLKVKFKPAVSNGDIRSKDNKGVWEFKSSGSNPKTFRWVADLKPAHAQRIANDFAREVSRVGLTESEWIRRQAKS